MYVLGDGEKFWRGNLIINNIYEKFNTINDLTIL